MDERLIKIEELLAAFDARQELYDELTQTILAQLRSNVLLPLCELFACNEEHVKWTDVDVADTLLSLVCTLQYESLETIPAFILCISPPTPVEQDAETIECTIRIGVPLHIVFAPIEDVRVHLNQLAAQIIKEAQSNRASVPEMRNDAPQFSLSKLTKEQLRQVLMFQSKTRGVTH